MFIPKSILENFPLILDQFIVKFLKGHIIYKWYDLQMYNSCEA